MDQIRKIIREQIESALAIKGQDFGRILKDQIDYLKDFELVGYKTFEDKEAWRFYGKHGFAIFDIFIVNNNDSWRLIIKMKDDSTHFSKIMGKKEIGPISGLEEFIDQTKSNLNNNLLIGPDVFNDEIDENKEKIVEKLLADLLAKEHILNTVTSPNLDRLKNICLKFNDISQEKSIEKIIEILADEFNGIDTLILALQDTEKIDFYDKLKKF